MTAPIAEVGGPMSYGNRLAIAHRPARIYGRQILRGAKPADLPVVQPREFELVSNPKTAQWRMSQFLGPSFGSRLRSNTSAIEDSGLVTGGVTL